MDMFRVVSPAPRAAWSAVVASDPNAMPSQTPEWMDAMTERSPWRDASRLYITESGRRVVFPMTRVGGRGRFSALVSPRRGWGYGGIVADGGVAPCDIALVSEDLAHIPELRFRARPNPLQSDMWNKFAPEIARLRKTSHVVDLHGGADGVRARFHRSANKGIATAEKKGVRVETVAGAALLPVFSVLARKSRRYWAERQHEPVWLAQTRGHFRDSEAKWQRIARCLGPDFEVTVAWHDRRPAAAAIVVNGPNSHGMRLAMDPELRHLCAPHLLNWVVLRNACVAGARWFFMGESATQGAAEFKEFLGARRYEYDEIDFERVPFSRSNRLLRAAVKRAVGFNDRQSAAAALPTRPEHQDAGR
jgi:hypothetical protein